MIKNVYEILREVESAPNRVLKQEVLRKNDFFYFKEVLKYAYNPNFQFYSEEFPKDYKKPEDNLPGLRMAGIESEIKKAYLWSKGHPVADSMTPEKRHILLLQILESFEPEEAIVWNNMLNKDLKIKGLSESLVRETFPELF